MKKMNFEKGYTMVEMMTVVAIIMIMSAILVSLNQPQKKFALQRNIYSLSASARRIQEMSMSIATINVAGVERVPEGGYGIELSTETDKNNKYTLYYNNLSDPADLIYSNGEQIENSPIKFSDNTIISSISGIAENGDAVSDITQVNVIYYPPDPKILIFYGADSDNVLKEATITLKLSGTNFIRKIYFNKLGLVSVDQKQEEITP